MKKLLDKFAYNPKDTLEVRFSKRLILVVALSCSCCGIMWSVMYYLLLGFGLTMLLPLVFIVIVGCAIPFSHLKGDHKPLIYAQLICITWVSALIQWSLGSMSDSGIVIAWSFLGPVGALLFLKRKQSYLWMAKFLLIVLISVVVEPKFSDDSRNVTDIARKIFYIMNLCFPGTVVFLASLYFVSDLIEQKNKNLNLLRLTEEKNKEILDSIRYAKRIQTSLLPTDMYIKKILNNKRLL